MADTCIAAPEPLQVKPTDPRVISPSLPGGSPNAASPSKTMPPTSSSPKLSSEASQATPLDPRLNHPHHQPAAAAAAASPWAHHQHALGGGCTAESPGQRSRGAGRQSEPTTVDAAGSDAGASSSEEESRQLQHGSAADTSPAHNASRIQPGDPQLHPKPGVSHLRMPSPPLLPRRAALPIYLLAAPQSAGSDLVAKGPLTPL